MPRHSALFVVHHTRRCSCRFLDTGRRSVVTYSGCRCMCRFLDTGKEAGRHLPGLKVLVSISRHWSEMLVSPAALVLACAQCKCRFLDTDRKTGSRLARPPRIWVGFSIPRHSELFVAHHTRRCSCRFLDTGRRSVVTCSGCRCKCRFLDTGKEASRHLLGLQVLVSISRHWSEMLGSPAALVLPCASASVDSSTPEEGRLSSARAAGARVDFSTLKRVGRHLPGLKVLVSISRHWSEMLVSPAALVLPCASASVDSSTPEEGRSSPTRAAGASVDFSTPEEGRLSSARAAGARVDFSTLIERRGRDLLDRPHRGWILNASAF
jgi:hypothetical protein